ncbi:hypothetical protein [Mycolicibacterium sp. lyk4-40-TYG-92]|nr:hypothetical protein [Mycolicibacterium sp. lyk4-40-TYG-92]
MRITGTTVSASGSEEHIRGRRMGIQRDGDDNRTWSRDAMVRNRLIGDQ